MKKFIMCVWLLFPVSTWAGEFEYSLGLGLNYGAIGGRVAYKTEESKYYIGLGVPAVSVGVQTAINENPNLSWGINVGRLFGILSADSDFVAINYSYHFDGFHNQGWEFGITGGYYHRSEHPGFFGDDSDEKDGGFVSFNLGYSF